MWCALAAGSAAAAALIVNVHLDFDRTITSAALEPLVRAEAAALWQPYGVALQWSDDEAAAFRVDAIVERSTRDRSPMPVLAQATIASDDSVRKPIRIAFDAVEALLMPRYTANPGFYQYALAAALGRVLAHELGHVLLGSPGYHDPSGLMRASFSVENLGRIDRSPFRLAAYSIARLQERIAVLSRSAPGDCGC